MNKNNDMCVAPNYEDMYFRLLEEHKKSCAAVEELKMELNAADKRCIKLEAQMEVVRLIFGRR